MYACIGIMRLRLFKLVFICAYKCMKMDAYKMVHVRICVYTSQLYANACAESH